MKQNHRKIKVKAKKQATESPIVVQNIDYLLNSLRLQGVKITPAIRECVRFSIWISYTDGDIERERKKIFESKDIALRIKNRNDKSKEEYPIR